MGYHIILHVRGKLKDTYASLKLYELLTDNLFDCSDDEFLQSLKDKFISLDIAHFYKFDEEDGKFYIRIEKKPYQHKSRLEDDYMIFVKDILLPITSEISCTIEHDDLGFPSTSYSNEELREYHYIYVIEKSKLQLGKRLPLSFVNNTILDKIPISKDIYDSDPDTWSSDLRRWWYDVREPKNTLSVAEKLERDYSDDEDIKKIIEKLKLYGTRDDVKFEFKYR